METLEQKTQRQLEIEERGIEIGVKKYLDQMAKASQTNTMSELPSGVALTSKLVEPVAAGIRGFLLVNSKRGKKNYVYTYLNALSDEYVLSYITVKTILNYVSDKEVPKLQRVCEAIGSSILAELNVKQFRKTHKEYIEGFDHSIHITTPDSAFFIEDYREESLPDEVKALLKDFILKIGL